MPEAFFQRPKGHRCYIGAQKGGLGNMVWRAHGRGDDLDLVVDVLAAPVIVTNAGNNICKLGDAIFPEISRRTAR